MLIISKYSGRTRNSLSNVSLQGLRTDCWSRSPTEIYFHENQILRAKFFCSWKDFRHTSDFNKTSVFVHFQHIYLFWGKKPPAACWWGLASWVSITLSSTSYSFFIFWMKIFFFFSLRSNQCSRVRSREDKKKEEIVLK